MIVNRYERLLAHAPMSRLHRAILAGTARSLRECYHDYDDRNPAAVATASGVVAPLVFLFVWWCLLNARLQGIKRLYFLARDGQIMHQVAEQLVNIWHLDIDVRYLYCSRESLLLPSFEQVGDFEEYWITWGYLKSITIEELCKRLATPPDSLTVSIHAAGLSAYLMDPQRPISRSDMIKLQTLLRREDLAASVRRSVLPRFEQALGYLKQEGFADPVPYALVDTGWRGSSHYALSGLLRKGKIRPAKGITGFYLGLNKGAQCFDSDALHAFLFDWRRERRDDRLSSFICFEMLLSADHGRTVDYQLQGTRYLPVLETPRDTSMLSTVALHHTIAIAYASRAASVLVFDKFPHDAADVCRRLTRAFISWPTTDEAELYGQWPMSSEIRERDYQPMAPSMDLRSLIANAAGIKKVRGYWPQASLIRGGLQYVNCAYNAFLQVGLLELYRRCILRY